MVTATLYTPYVAATLNGSPISGVRKARVVSSFTDPITKIYLSVYPDISWSEGDTLAVTMGSGTNNVLSGTGQIFKSDSPISGLSFDLSAFGPLLKARKYRNNNPNGLTLTDLTGGPADDKAITEAVLTIAGVIYSPADIGGTGIVRGALAPSAYTWRAGETALAYLMRLSKASLGYRLIESIGGAVKRVQLFGRPQGTAQFFLNEGVDIFPGAHTEHDSSGRYTAVTVTGFDYQDGNGAVSFSSPDPIPAGVEPFVYPSEMIERALESDPGGGISAENVATNFVLPEVDRVSIRVSGVRTPRDDTFGPGQTHQITGPRLNLTNERVWLFGVTRECDSQWFSQTLDYVGGSTATGGYTGP